MLHIKILSYEEHNNTKLADMYDKYFDLKNKEKSNTRFENAEFLCDVETIERRFIEILNTDIEAFRDELSSRLLKELDDSYRENDYGIVTPMGKSCITCISSDIKLALLLYYFHMRSVTIITRFRTAKEDVWVWLSKNTEMTLYMREKDYRDTCSMKTFSYFYYKLHGGENIEDLIDIEYHGELLDAYFSSDADKMCQFTKSFEEAIFRETFKDKKLLYFRRTEKLTLGEFIASFDIKNEVIDELCYYKDVHNMDIYDYTVTVPGNYIYANENHSLQNYMVVCLEEHHIYGSFTFFDSNGGCKTLLETILWGALIFYECEFSQLTGLITDENDQDISENYLACARWGYYIDTENKEIIIYEAEQGVIRFHNAFRTVNDDEEDD